MRRIEARRDEHVSRLGWQPAEPPERPVLFVNPRSGGGRAERSGLAERARERGIRVVLLGSDRPLRELVADALAGGADALGMAGGDGSLSIVAATAHQHDLPFVCIPAGTRNHFARDLGVDPRDVLEALDAFSDAVERHIDMAEVNDRVFLNNVSLGIYGDAVRQPGYRDAKFRTLLETAREVLGPGGKADELFITDDHGVEHANPALILVSNNPYALEGRLARGVRPTLDGGRLGVIVLDARPTPPHPPGRAWTTDSVEIRGSRPVHAGIDGEAVEVDPPIRFRILPRALRVRIPARPAGALAGGGLQGSQAPSPGGIPTSP